jgi:hypothetical protein
MKYLFAAVGCGERGHAALPGDCVRHAFGKSTVLMMM